MEYTQNEDGSFTVTVDGAAKTYPNLEAVVAAASKADGANKRFEEAAAIKREVQQLLETHGPKLEIAANLEKAYKSGDQAALIAAVTAIGMDKQEVEQFLQQQGGGQPTQKPAQKGGSTLDPNEMENLKYLTQLAAEGRRLGLTPSQMVSRVHGDVTTSGKQTLRTQIAEALKKDPSLATLLKKPETSEALVQLGESFLSHEFVEGTAKSLDATAIEGAVRKALATVRRLPGFQADQSGGTTLGATPPASVGFTGAPRKPVERPPLTDDSPDRDKYMNNRLAEIMAEMNHPEE